MRFLRLNPFQRVRERERGMTLVEVMVSLTLTALIVGVVGVMMSQSDRQFRFISQQSVIEREYRDLSDYLSAIFRRQAIHSLVIPESTDDASAAESVLLSWKGNDPKISGQLIRKDNLLIWRQNKAAEPGVQAEQSDLALADDLKAITFVWDAKTRKIQSTFTWEMSNGQSVKRFWQMNLTRFDQPLVPEASDEPLPSALPD